MNDEYECDINTLFILHSYLIQIFIYIHPDIHLYSSIFIHADIYLCILCGKGGSCRSMDRLGESYITRQVLNDLGDPVCTTGGWENLCPDAHGIQFLE